MSFSDFYASDLSDITSSSEDEYTSTTVKRSSAKKSKRDQTSAYTIVNTLRPPRSTSYSVRALYEQIVDGSINLDPAYQRDIVWPEQKQIGLIDSVFRNYYIPPIIFAVSTSDDGSETRVCIDGKQRLTSIQKFLDGLIPHRDHVTSKRYWCKKYGANARLLLPTPLQQAFANKQIVCVEYDSLTEEQEREIFQRVQLGVALTPAERMQAIAGHWPNFIREIQSQVLGDDGFGNSFDWGRARGRDFHGLASIAYLIEQLPVHKIPPTAQTMEKWLTRTTPVPSKLRTGVLDTFRVYLSLVREKAYKKAFAQRVSPIEFVMIGVMIFLNREILSLTQLSHAVEKMRSDVRSVEKDVRSNGRVSKLLFKFILEKLPRLVLRSDNKGDKSAQSTLSLLPRAPAPASPLMATPTPSTPTEPTTSSRPGRPPGRKKRKRRVQSDDSDDSFDLEGDDDDEYVPTWRRSSGRSLAKVARSSATTQRRLSEAEPVPVPASAPPRVSSFALKAENDKPATPTPTPSLTPHAPSVSSQSETHTASAPPMPPPVSTPKIKAEKIESSVVPGSLRTAMDRFAALRAANAHSPASSSATVSTSPTAVAPTTEVSPDEPVPGSAIAPIDLEALDKLQQLLTYSAGLKAISNASPVQSPVPQTRTSPEAQGTPVENQTSNLGDAVLTLQKLGAFLSRPQQQQQQQQQQQEATQQTEEPPNGIPIPHQAKAEPQTPQPSSPVVKTERVELEPPPRFPRSMRGQRGGGMRRPNYRHNHFSLSRDYDRRPPPRREYEYDRGRPYYRRVPSARSYSPSRSRSHSPHSHSRSRSVSREKDRDHGYLSAGSSSRGRGWQTRFGPGPGVGAAIGPGPGPGPAIGPGGSRPGSISNLGRRRSSPGPAPVGFAPRKFDFTRERARRERDYQDLMRERRTSNGAPGSEGGVPGPS